MGVLGVEQVRQVKGSEGGVAEEDAHVESASIVELALANLDEATKLSQAAPAVVEEIADEGVDDDVDTTAGGGLLDALDEGWVLGAEDVVGRDTELVDEVVTLGLGVDGGVDGGTDLLGEGDGGEAETIGALVDEDRFALAEVSTLIDGVQSSSVGEEEGGDNSELLGLEQLVDGAGRDTDCSSKLVRSVGDSTVTNLDILDILTDSGDDTGEVKGSGLVAAVDTAEKGVDVLGVQADSLDIDINEARRRSGDLLRHRLEVDGVGGTSTANGQTSRVSSSKSLLLKSRLGLDAATEERVDVVIRAITGDVEETLGVNVLAVITTIGSSEGVDGLLRGGLSLGAELADVADIEDGVAEGRLLEHESTGQTVGEGQVGLRSIAKHVATSDPEEVVDLVGDELEAGGVLDADGGQEVTLQLEERDGDVSLGNLEGVEGVDGHNGGLSDTGILLEVRSEGAGKVGDTGRGLVGVDDESLAAGELLGGQRARSKDDLLANIDQLEARRGEGVDGGIRLAGDDDTLVRDEGGDLFGEALGGGDLGNDDNVKGTLAAVLSGVLAILVNLTGVPRLGTSKGCLAVEDSLPLLGLVSLSVATELEDAHAGGLVTSKIDQSTNSSQGLVVLQVLGGVVDEVGNVRLEGILGRGAETEHIGLPVDAEGGLALEEEVESLVGLGSVNLLASVQGDASVLEVDDGGATGVAEGGVHLAAGEAGLLGASVDLGLGLGAVGALSRLDTGLGDEDGEPGLERADLAGSRTPNGSLDGGVNGDGMDGVVVSQTSSNDGRLQTSGTDGFTASEAVVSLEADERLEVGAEAEALIVPLLVPTAGGPVVVVSSVLDGDALVLSLVDGLSGADGTRAVDGGLASSPRRDGEVVPVDRVGRAGDAAGGHGGVQLKVLGSSIVLLRHVKSSADVDVAELKGQLGLGLALDAGDLGHGLDGEGDVASTRKDGLVLELVVLDPGHLAGLEDVAPGVVDAVAGEGLGSEELVTDVLAVALLGRRTRLVPEETARVVPGVGAEVVGEGDASLGETVDLAPVQGVAVGVETGGEGLDGLVGIGATDEGGAVRNGSLVMAVLLADLGDGALESGVRAELDEVDLAAGSEVGQSSAELHGLLEVLAPVLGKVDAAVEDGEVIGAEANGRVHLGLDRGRGLLISEERGEQLLVQRTNLLHELGVVGTATGLELADKLALGLEVVEDSLDTVLGTSDGDALGGVDTGNTDGGLEAKAGNELAGRLRGKTSSNHSTLRAEGADGVTTVVGNKDSLGEAEEASSVGGTNLTRGVTDDGAGGDAPSAEELNETDLDSSADRLAASDLVDAAGAGAVKQGLLEGPVRGIGSRESLQDSVKVTDGVAELLARNEELLTHAGVLSTLTGEDEAEGEGVEGLADSSLLDSDDLAAGLGEQDTPVAEVVTTTGKSVGELLEGSSVSGSLGDLGDLLDAGLEGLGRSSGDGEDNELLLIGDGDGELQRLGELVEGEVALGALENDVGIGTTVSEGVDRGTAEGTRPLLDLGGNLDVALVEDELGVELLHTSRGRDLALLESHDGLEDGRQTGSTLRVTDVGLDGADNQRRSGLALEQVANGVDLDRVTDGGTGAVSLNVVSLVPVETGVLVRLADDSLLELTAGQRDTGSAAGGVGGAAADDGADGVAVAEGGGEALDVDGIDSFSSTVAIGRGVEGVASAGGGEDTTLGSHNVEFGGENHVGGGDKGGLAVTSLESIESLVKSVDGGGASRVYGEGRTVQVEDVGDTVGHDGGAGTRRSVSVDVVGVTGLVGLVIDGEVTDVDTSVGAGEALHGGAGALKGLIGDFEELALLRIHVGGLEVVDTEEAIVEVAQILVDEVSTRDVGATAALTVGVVVTLDVVSLLGGRTLSGLLVDQEVPEGGGRADVAGESAG